MNTQAEPPAGPIRRRLFWLLTVLCLLLAVWAWSAQRERQLLPAPLAGRDLPASLHGLDLEPPPPPRIERPPMVGAPSARKAGVEGER
jgi:hypothetical protein